MWGGIEAGGTKFVCAIGTGPGDLRARVEFPTTLPEETVLRAAAFFREGLYMHGPLRGIGIGSFGPVDLDPVSPTFGYITSTPKAGWRNVDLAGAIRRETGIQTAFDTDANAAALGEFRWGAARGLDTFLYLTIGTGIGGGGMANGRLMHGQSHPEMGHIRIPHDRTADPYEGCCPFHRDCLEGLASGSSIEGRWKRRGEQLPGDHEAWRLEARYMALGLASLICAMSPQRIILGGGLMRRETMLPAIRRNVDALLNGYLKTPEIVLPQLGNDAGVAGAIALAQARLAL